MLSLFLYHLSGLREEDDLALLRVPCQDLCTDVSKMQANKEKRGVIFKRAESYVKEYRDAEREKIRLNRLSKQEGSFYVDAEPKLVFVLRIKG
jgi:Ribosomal L30 N-terminal domain